MGIVEDVREAATGTAKALTRSGYRADFGPGSLWELERFFDVEAAGGRARAGGPLAQHLGARLFGLGSYLGEVVRRGSGGTWDGDDADPQAEINVAVRLPGGTVVWPIQRVMKRFSNGPEDGLVAYGVALGLDIGPRPAPTTARHWWSRRR